MQRLTTLFISFLVLSASNAFAERFSSASFFGYSITDHSSQGINQASGTHLGFDGSFVLNEYFDLGLRTVGGGAEYEDLNFYRLATGPLLSFKPVANFRVNSSLAFFNESAMQSDKRVFKARGYLFQLGWQRNMEISRGLSFGLGGFWSRYWGKGQQMLASATEADASSLSSGGYIGNQRGFQLSAQFTF